jgi:hypothetical protein
VIIDLIAEAEFSPTLSSMPLNAEAALTALLLNSDNA